MNKAISLASVFFLCVTIANAQQAVGLKRISKEGPVEAYAGPSIKVPAGHALKNFELITETRYVICKTTNSDDKYVVADTLLNVIDEYSWEDARINGRMDLNLIHFNGNYYKLDSKTDKEKKQNIILLNTRALGVDSVYDSKEINTIEGNDYYEYFNNAFTGWQVSRTGDQLLVYVKMAKQLDGSGKRVPSFRFMVFNSNLEMTWQQDLHFFDNSGTLAEGGNGWFSKGNHASIQLSGSGAAYIWGEVDMGSHLDPEARYKLKVYRLDKSGVSSSSTKDFRCEDCVVTATDDHLVMIGTYGQENVKMKAGYTMQGVEGLKIMRWNGNSERQPFAKEIPFGIDHLSNNKPSKVGKALSKKVAKDYPLLSEYFKVKEVVVLDNNSLLITGQNRNIEVEVATNGYTKETHSGLDIHLFNISPQSKLTWSTQIPVTQINKTGLGLGFVSKVWDNKIHVMFNDHFDNVAKEWTTESKASKFTGTEDHLVSYVTIDMNDPNAEQNRLRLWKSRSAGVLFEPHNFGTEPNLNFGLMYLSGAKNKQRLIRIEFK